jgi:hypothetical protein
MEETVAVRSGTITQPDSIEIATDASAAFSRLFDANFLHLLEDPDRHLSSRCAELAIFMLSDPLSFFY